MPNPHCGGNDSRCGEDESAVGPDGELAAAGGDGAGSFVDVDVHIESLRVTPEIVDDFVAAGIAVTVAAER